MSEKPPVVRLSEAERQEIVRRVVEGVAEILLEPDERADPAPRRRKPRPSRYFRKP